MAYPSLTIPLSSNPGILGGAAQGATNLGSWLNAGGAGIGTIADTMAGAYQARVAFNNAALARSDAENALLAGEYDAERKLLQTGQTVGAQKAAQAAGNIDVNRGSAVAVRAATEQLGALDTAMIMYNAKRQAYGYKVQASNYRAQGALGLASTGFGLARGLGKTYSSFLSGSTALSSQALALGGAG